MKKSTQLFETLRAGLPVAPVVILLLTVCLHPGTPAAGSLPVNGLTRGCPMQGNTMLISPNPAQDVVEVLFSLSSDLAARMTLFSSTGQVLFGQDVTMLRGDNTIRLDITAIPAGSYFLKITNDKKLEITGERTMIKR